MDATNLASYLDASARRFPDRIALVDPDGTSLTYRELHHRAACIAGMLRARGVRPGDRVGLFLKNGHEFIELQLALSAIGAIGVQIGYRLNAAEVAYIVANAETKALFAHHDLTPVVDEVLARGDSLPLRRSRKYNRVSAHHRRRQSVARRAECDC